MSIMTSSPDAADPAPRLLSLAELRADHARLLDRQQDGNLAATLLDEVERFLRRGQSAGVLLDSPADRRAAQSLLDYWDTTLFRAGREIGDVTLARFDPTLAPELDGAACPYLGLDAFRNDDHAKFFGRQRLVDDWIARLNTQRFLPVLGPSGSGKSSLVLGGLIPALTVGALPGSQDWHYYPPMMPGSDPLTSLARLTRPADISPADWIQPRVDHFRADPGQLATLASQLGGVPVVLVVDQFEETFTLCTDDATRQAFADNLLGLIQAPDARHIVILTMRSDFETHLPRLPQLQPLFEQAQARVTPLYPSELREAIEKPAELIGLKFEDGVVAALVKDMRDEKAGLPLLQFTLLELWKARKRNRVTLEAYNHLGGAHWALERCADAFYDALTRQDQETAKQILLRMVRLDPGGLEVTSRRVLRESLYQNSVAREWIDDVLAKLIAARLIRLTKGDTPGDDQVEVAHEALVRNWQRLLDWLQDERQALRGRLRLTAAAEQWDARNRQPDALLRGQVLAEALSYAGLPALEAQFLEQSQARELAQRRRETGLRRACVGVAVTVLLTVTILASIAVGQAQLAQAQAFLAQERADFALSRQLVAQAGALLKDRQPDLALLLSVEALRAHDSIEARDSLLTALTYVPDSALVGDHATSVKGVAFSPDGRTLASVDDAGRTVLWNATTHRPLGPALRSRSPGDMTLVAAGLAFSQDGSTFLVTTDDGQGVVWDVVARHQLPNWGTSSPTPTRSALPLVSRDDDTLVVWDFAARAGRPLGVQLTDLDPGTLVFALSPDGKVVAGGSEDGRLRLWNATTGQFLESTSGARLDGSVASVPQSQVLPSQSSAITSLGFSPDSLKLAWGTADGTIGIWQVTRERQVGSFRGTNAAVSSIAFGPDDRLTRGSSDRLAWGASDGKLYLRDAFTGTRLPIAQIIGEGRVVSAAVAFSPDGRLIAAASPNGNVTLLPAAGQGDLLQLPDYGAPVTSLAFRPDGQLLATGDRDGMLRLWDLGQSPLEGRPLEGHQGAITGLAFSPTGDRLASGADGGQLVIWDLATGRPLDPALPRHQKAISRVDFGPDGRTLVSAGGDGIRLWNLDERPPRFTPLGDPVSNVNVQSVAFSPDGKLLLSGAYDGTLTLWDVTTRERRAQLRPSSAGPDSSAALDSPFNPPVKSP